MGVNQCKISNKTGKSLWIITFNNTDIVYWFYRHMYQLPVTGGEITVDGLAGNGAVKVGVIYNEKGGRYVYDLFRVSHGVTLSLRMVRAESGVIGYDEVEGVELIGQGRTIRM